MKRIILSKSGAQKISKLNAELFFSDIEDSIKSFVPGEWVEFYNSKKKESSVGFVNPLVPNNSPCGYVVLKDNLKKEFDPWKLLEMLILRAIERRENFIDYEDNARLVYGIADNLPGLIVDTFENVTVIQINTAGIDKYRNEIKQFFSTRFPSKNILMLDNEQYRMREGLPVYDKDDLNIDEIFIKENDIKLVVAKNRMQKVGFYYDHRENRNRMRNFLKRTNIKIENGLDLFCYIGAWGFSLLKEGVKKVDFVDQGDFEQDITRGMEKNSLNGDAAFHRGDVFDFLKSLKETGKKYDIICSDPPAFCKSPSEKKRAYDGYLKLHELCLSNLKENSFFVACSCTHYIELEEFVRNINEAAIRTKRNIQLLDIGLQGFDHPMRSLNDKQHYLKYTLFLVE